MSTNYENNNELNAENANIEINNNAETDVTITGRISGRVKPETEIEYAKVFNDFSLINGVEGKLSHDDKMKVMIEALKTQLSEQSLKDEKVAIEKFNMDLSNELHTLEETYKHMLNIFESVQSKVNSHVADYKYQLATKTIQKSKTIESNALKMLTDSDEKITKLLDENRILREFTESKKEELNRKDEEIEQLDSELISERAKNSKMEQKIQGLQIELDKSKKNEEKYSKEIRDSLNKTNDLLNENRTIRKQYEEVEKQLSSLKNENLSSSKEVELLKVQLLDAKKEIETLRPEKERRAVVEVQNVQAQQEINKLNDIVEELKAELENVKKERDSINIEYQVLKRELDLKK